MGTMLIDLLTAEEEQVTRTPAPTCVAKSGGCPRAARGADKTGYRQPDTTGLIIPPPSDFRSQPRCGAALVPNSNEKRRKGRLK